MLTAVWLNGTPTNGIPAGDRGLAYGDGHFTTLPVREGVPVLLDYHWLRLREASEALGIPVQLMPKWQRDFQRFIAHYPNMVAKIIITRGCNGRGYLPAEQAHPNCYFMARPPVAHPVSHRTGIDSGVLKGYLGLNPRLAGLKHLNRMEQVMLRQELEQAGYPEAVVLDLNGEVVEGVFSNLFLIKEQLLYTPTLTSAGVNGVMRRFLMDYLQNLQHPVRELPLRLEHLEQADELFFCNSVYGIWPVRRFNGTMMPSNPITQRLQHHLKNARITA